MATAAGLQEAHRGTHRRLVITSSPVDVHLVAALAGRDAYPHRQLKLALPSHSRPRVRGMMVEPSEVTDMDLYLMQHGQATTETADPERPLTDAGRAAVQRVAKRARAADVRISACLHSGKLRAEQTAQLLVREIGVEPSAEARPGLAPNDPVVPVAQRLRAETEHQSLALVGHMPFLGRLASLLVAGDEQAQVVGFQMGGLVKLEPKVDRDGFSVAWALPPDLA
jgi:phosphohistidine phosphatase